jgi:flagellar basal-body rod protein FlgB
VDFALQLDALRHALESGADTAGIAPRLAPVLDASGMPAKIHLDAEVADMAQNAVQFQTLAKALQKHLSILATAASDGRR